MYMKLALDAYSSIYSSQFFLHENVLAFFTRFFGPGFFAQAPVFGMVSLPSV